MGSPFSISVYADAADRYAAAAAACAYDEIARVENLLTEFRSSPLSDINASAGIRPVRVPDELYRLIEFAQSAARDSNGAFDITSSAVGILWHGSWRSRKPPSADAISAARQFVDYRLVELRPQTQEVYLPYRNMRIGLGSIGKGYAVDKAFRVLRAAGYENICVNGAGDIRVYSAVDAPRPWRIGIRNPFAQNNCAAGSLIIARGAVATSGDYERCFTAQGKKYHHIMDGRSGGMRDDVASVTVAAGSAILANAYATTAMALGAEEGAVFLRRKRGIHACMITSSGSVIRCAKTSMTGKELDHAISEL
jgi:thiamine biosynthesis lipoprotein